MRGYTEGECFLRVKDDGTWEIIVTAPKETMVQLRQAVEENRLRFHPMCWAGEEDDFPSSVMLWGIRGIQVSFGGAGQNE